MSLSDHSFTAVARLFEQASGIRLGASKRALVTGRLQSLAQARGLERIDDYVQMLVGGDDPVEYSRMVDRLTTNETYFFREPQHFDLLEQRATAWRLGSHTPRVWSAASSSGEEAYSIAMVLAEELGLQSSWEIVGTDLSTAMVKKAAVALYPMERCKHIPMPLLKRWCLRGHGPHEGELLIARELRERVRFERANLMRSLPESLGTFDVIFLRNVLIYFEAEAKREIVARVLAHLAPNGLLLSGHAESLANLQLPLRSIAPAVYVHA